jgi:hypothetical protein
VFCFALQLLPQTFLILRRTELDMIKTVFWSLCEVPVIPGHAVAQWYRYCATNRKVAGSIPDSGVPKNLFLWAGAGGVGR